MSRNYKRINWQRHYADRQKITRSKSLRLIRPKRQKKNSFSPTEKVDLIIILTRLNRGDRRKNKIDFHVVLSSRIHQPNQIISVIYTLRNIKNSKKIVKIVDVFEYFLPSHLLKLQLSVEIFVPGQSIPFHLGAGLEHVRARVLFPSPHVTLHGCHDDHWLQLPFTDDWKKQLML